MIPLLLLALAPLAYSLIRHKSNFIDFDVYRTAAVRAVHGEPLYRESDGHYQYKYLPAFAVVMAPFGVLPRAVSESAWYVLSVGLLVVFVRESLRLLPDRARTEAFLAGITVLVMAKSYIRELHHGQTNVLLGALVLLALGAIVTRRGALAGALVGLAVFAKPYAAIVIPWLAVSAGLASVAVSLAVVGAGLILPVVVYGWTGNLEQLQGWRHTVTQTTPENLLLPENISLATMWAKWLGPGAAATLLALASSALAVLMVGVLVLRRRAVQRPEYLELALLLLLVPLISPQGWDYVLMLGTPAVMCLIDRMPRLSAGWRVASQAALALVGFTLYDLLGRSLYREAMAASILSVAAIALAAALVNLRWKEEA